MIGVFSDWIYMENDFVTRILGRRDEERLSVSEFSCVSQFFLDGGMAMHKLMISRLLTDAGCVGHVSNVPFRTR